MQKVKAKQTLFGSYGHKTTGEEFEVTDKIAQHLIDKGLVEAVSEASGNDPRTQEQILEDARAMKAKEGKSSITENKSKKKAAKK
jgi:hypothetical protein